MIILLYPATRILLLVDSFFFKFKKKQKKKKREKRIHRNTFSHMENSKNERFHSILEKKNRSPDINERNQKYSSVKWPRNTFVPPIGNNFHPSILKAREMWKAFPRICQSHDKLLVDIIATDCFQQRDTNFHATSFEWIKEEEKKREEEKERERESNGNGLRVKR